VVRLKVAESDLALWKVDALLKLQLPECCRQEVLHSCRPASLNGWHEATPLR
jgi:hypothetical protein